MAISYSGIVGYGKASLPSVESWGTNNNILKDPPKSITTYRRDKVGSNSAITEDIDMSGDRVAESIRAYPRGVNPMVGISYNGEGNAGIGRGQTLLTKGRQAKLPYRVMMDGAFRPPILAPVDLLPLSRMPRNLTKINATICNPDFTKKISCTADKKTYKQNPLQTAYKNNVIFNIKKPTLISVKGQTKETRIKDVRSNVKFETGLQRDVAGGKKIREVICAPVDVKAISSQNIFVNRNINTGAKSKDAIRENVLKGQIFCPLNSKSTSKIRDLYGKKVLERTACSAKDVGATKSFKMFKSGAGEGHQQSISFITDRTRDIAHASIDPKTAVPRQALIQDRPDYKRVFGMGGILIPEGGVYNVARH